MFLIREVSPDDIDQVHQLARHLNTVNLPDDRATLEAILELSRRSFAGEIETFEREYVLVLQDAETRRIIGTTMIHAQHGSRRAPHIFFEVATDERYSQTLDRHFAHQILRIGYNYEGPTEIGGLVLLPEFRGRVRGLGRLLSYVRFLYIGLHLDKFRREVLSELLPPLEPDGTSLLWESLGRHFTGLSYQEADLLSKSNKEFIRSLFPEGPIYTSLLPEDVQSVIGQVGPQTRGVEKMLEQIGFEYAHRIDPFDGGPHFVAPTREITIVAGTRRARVIPGGEGPEKPLDERTPDGIVAAEREVAPRFRAVRTRLRLEDGGKEIALDDAARAVLGVSPGDEVGYVVL